MPVTRKFLLLPVLAMLVLAGAACGGGGKSAQTAVKTGLKGSGFEQIKAVNGSVDDSGRLTVVGENGSRWTSRS